MTTQFDIERILEKRIFSEWAGFWKGPNCGREIEGDGQGTPEFKAVRRKLREFLEVYEKKTWGTENEISEDKLKESILNSD